MSLSVLLIQAYSSKPFIDKAFDIVQLNFITNSNMSIVPSSWYINKVLEKNVKYQWVMFSPLLLPCCRVRLVHFLEYIKYVYFTLNKMGFFVWFWINTFTCILADNTIFIAFFLHHCHNNTWNISCISWRRILRFSRSD